MAEIYAVDFDGTLCESMFPKIGAPIQKVIDHVKALAAEGNKIILWTCRTDERLQEAIDWCSEQGLEFDAVNENLEERIQEYGGDTRKASASFYIDDKAITVESIINGEVEQKVSGPKEFKPMWALKQAASPEEIDIFIYGNVEADSYDWWTGQAVESETSAKHFRSELAKYPNAKRINIFINSYGGSVFEGTAIYSQLRRHTAEKVVHVDGFACSIASVIAMAGDRVIMPRNTMMMIHNIWNVAIGNASQLRKAADDLDRIMEGNRQAYLQKAGGKLDENQLIELLDAETWLTAEQCIELGLADEYAEEEADMSKAAEMVQKMNLSLTQRIQVQKSLAAQLRELAELGRPPISEPEPKPDPEPDPVPEPPKDPEPASAPAQNKISNMLAAFGAGKGRKN